MDDKEFICSECDAEFTVEHNGIDNVMFCPFCGTELTYDNNLNDEWEEEEDND